MKKELSKFLRSIKSFVGRNDIENKIKIHFKKIMKHSLIALDKIKNNKIYELLNCAFIDILRISAPEIPFDNETMEFFLEILIKWLMLEEHIKSSKLQKAAFFYVMHQIAKLSVLCLLFTTKLIDKVPIIIKKLFYFLEKEIYNEQQYQDFLECISSTVNEYSEIPIDLLKILLSYLCKDKRNKNERQAFDIAFNVIKENKSILGNKIRDFITPSPTQKKQYRKNNKEKEGKRKSKKTTNKKNKKSELSILDANNNYDANLFFEEHNYLKIIKELSKISSDFLLKLLGELNDEGLQLSKNYFSFSSFDLLRKILSNDNSYEIFKNWKLLCNNYFNTLKEDNLDKYVDIEEEKNKEKYFDIKFMIFKCAIKFLTRNDKYKLKETNIYLFIKDSLSYFLKNITSKNEIDKCQKVLLKSSNWNIISFCLMSLLSSKNNKKFKLVMDFFFRIIKEEILSKIIIQDFKDKKTTKMLNTLSKPFNAILLSFDDSIKLYQLSLDSILIQDSNFNYLFKKIQRIFDMEITPTTIKLMLLFYMSIYTQESTTIWYTVLHIIFTEKKEITEEETKENKNEDEKKGEVKYLNYIDFNIDNSTNKNNEEINNLIDFLNQYIIFVDEKSNPDSIKVLLSILFTIEIFLCCVHYQKETLSKTNKKILYMILNQAIKIVFDNNVINKNVFDVICKIILLSLHLCVDLGSEDELDKKIKQEINELLFVYMSEYVFKTDEIKPKYYAKLIYTYYKMLDNLMIKGENDNIFRIFPKNFIYLIKNEKKINCIAFVNELTFYSIDDKYSSFYFDPNLAENVINLLEEDINNGIDNDKNEIFKILEKNHKENGMNDEENKEILILTKNLIPKIRLITEIIKYQLNYFLRKILKNNEENINNDEQNFEIKNYIKTIFNNLFKLINTIVINKKFVFNLSKKKELDEIYLEDETNIEDKSKIIKKKKYKNDVNEKVEEKKESSIKMKKNLKISNIEDIINLNYIQQYINLLFYMNEIGISFSFRKLVKISNLMLVKDIRIRRYFVTKIHNSLIKLKKSHRNLVGLYSMILLGLSDQNEAIEKMCKNNLSIFLDLLKIKLIKYEDNLNSDGYIYIPEVYIFYLIVFIIFNNNINIYYQQNSNLNNNKYLINKYFMNIFSNYLKEIKKKFGFVDSTFLLKALNEMKRFDCINIKKIKCLDNENVFLSNNILLDDNSNVNDNKEKIEVNFNKVKDSLIDNIMTIVYSDYLSDKKRIDKDGNGIYPQIPNILTGKDIEFKDNYLFNFNKYHNLNKTQSQENNKNSRIINSSNKSKEKYYGNKSKKIKKFSFNEYFKEENEEDEIY